MRDASVKRLRSGPGPRLDDRALSELGIHLLAQLPDDATLVCGAIDAALERVARAYGVQHRVASGSHVGTVVVTPQHEQDLAEHASDGFAGLCDRLGDCEVSSIRSDHDEVFEGARIVVITNLPAHYRQPLFNGMARRLAAVDATLTVLFLGEDDPERPWLASVDEDGHFDYAFMSGVRVPVRQRAPRLPLGLERHLRALRPSVILMAGLSPLVAPRVIRIARALKATVGIWSGETASMRTATSYARRRLRRQVLTGADFGIAYGSSALAYLRSVAPTLPAVIGRNTAPILDGAEEVEQREGLRLVFVGDLASRRKGCDVAIEAIRLVSNDGVNLRVIGSGRLQGELLREAAADERVTFLGSLRPADCLRELTNADALLFPTRSDIFGLVLVEAMGASTVPIVSSAAGAVHDLALDGGNALVMDHLDPPGWASAISRLAREDGLLRSLRTRARQTIEARWTMLHSVDAMMAGLRLGVFAAGDRQ